MHVGGLPTWIDDVRFHGPQYRRCWEDRFHVQVLENALLMMSSQPSLVALVPWHRLELKVPTAVANRCMTVWGEVQS